MNIAQFDAQVNTEALISIEEKAFHVGVVVPHSWYHRLTKADSTPDQISIIILAELLNEYQLTGL